MPRAIALQNLQILSIMHTFIFRPHTVAHACNPGYMAGGDQKDYSLRLAQAKN
jgi:hypothetical protein